MQNIETVIVEKGLCHVDSRILTDAYKQTRKTVCSELLEKYENGGDDFLARTVAEDETWSDHFESETKTQSIEWHYTNSLYSSGL